MRYPPDILDEIRSRLSVSQVVGRRVKLKRAGREFVGLSPFKQEKTPSFTVNDQKSFYHCFATGEHGDIFTFLMKTEGLSFPESVERLAGEAGVPLPAPSPEAAQKTATNDRLRAITACAAQFFQTCLQQPAAAHAQNYLQERGLSIEEVKQFQLGYAPNSRDALKQHLQQQGFETQDIVLSGMAIGGPDIPVPYDRFRDRIIFPITDLKQRVIAFGGRALDPNQPAKYLNSPETPLFHKGFQLYNAAQAREAAYQQKAIIVTEGYMDVIAMHKAGFANTVAPLGTALTAEQITLLWRMAAEPVLCFDGDPAGQKAAYRAVETTLPLLKPGHSIKFAFLPDGQDPDDVLNNEGKEEMQAILAAAKPLSEVLWQKEFKQADWNTPERRAALEQTLLTLVNSIQDQTVKSHYTRDIKSRLWRTFQSKSTFQSKNQEQNNRSPRQSNWASKPYQSNPKYKNTKQPASHWLITSPLMQGKSLKKDNHEPVIVVMLLNHPWLLETEDEHVASLKFTTEAAETLRNATLEAHFLENSLDRAALQSHLESLSLASQASHMQSAIAQNGPEYAQPTASREAVLLGWQELMRRHHKAKELRKELQAAEQAYREEGNQQNFERLKSLQQALEQSLLEIS